MSELEHELTVTLPENEHQDKRTGIAIEHDGSVRIVSDDYDDPESKSDGICSDGFVFAGSFTNDEIRTKCNDPNNSDFNWAPPGTVITIKVK